MASDSPDDYGIFQVGKDLKGHYAFLLDSPEIGDAEDSLRTAPGVILFEILQRFQGHNRHGAIYL